MSSEVLQESALVLSEAPVELAETHEGERMPAAPEVPTGPRGIVVPPQMAQRIAKMIEGLETLLKDGEHPHFGYSYPTISQVRGVVGKALARAGIVVIPEISRVSRAIRRGEKGAAMERTVVELFLHVVSPDGYFTVRWFGEAEDPADKGLQKAISSGMKSFLLNFSMAALQEEEEEASSSSLVQEPERHWIDDPKVRTFFWGKARKEFGLTPEEVHKVLGVSSVREFRGTLEEAIEILKRARR